MYSCSDATCSSWYTITALVSKIPRSLVSFNMLGTWWSGNLLFLQSLSQPLPNCDNGCKLLGKIYHRMTFDTFMTICMREYTPALLPERVHCVLMWLHGHPLLWHVCFIWSEFIIYHISSNPRWPWMQDDSYFSFQKFKWRLKINRRRKWFIKSLFYSTIEWKPIKFNFKKKEPHNLVLSLL